MFVSIDGCDGCGKTTQIERLAQWLCGQGYQVLTCRDPGTTPLGETVRQVVLHRHDLRIDPRAEMLLYMAARAQLVDEVIRPALSAGKTVLSDRYLLANVVYQGYGGGLEVAQLWEVGRVAVAGLMPDLTIVLDVPVEVAAQRLAAPGIAATIRTPTTTTTTSTATPAGAGARFQLDRLEGRGHGFQDRVRQGYLAEAARHPDQIVVIDASGSIEAVHRAICEVVSRHLGRK